MVVGSPTVMWKVGGCAACSSGILSCLDTDGGCCCCTLVDNGSLRSALISANVVAGCFDVLESSFAGGGGGATVSFEVVSPRGPRGSD